MFDNEVYKGYVIQAMKELGKSCKEIHAMLDALREAFNILTENEAQKLY